MLVSVERGCSDPFELVEAEASLEPPELLEPSTWRRWCRRPAGGGAGGAARRGGAGVGRPAGGGAAVGRPARVGRGRGVAGAAGAGGAARRGGAGVGRPAGGGAGVGRPAGGGAGVGRPAGRGAAVGRPAGARRCCRPTRRSEALVSADPLGRSSRCCRPTRRWRRCCRSTRRSRRWCRSSRRWSAAVADPLVEALVDVLVSTDPLVSVEPLVDPPVEALVSTEAPAEPPVPLDVLVSTEAPAEPPVPLDVLVSTEALAEPPVPLAVPTSTEAPVEPPVSTVPLVTELVSRAWATAGRTPPSRPAVATMVRHRSAHRRRRCRPLRVKNPLSPNDLPGSCTQTSKNGQASCLPFRSMYPARERQNSLAPRGEKPKKPT